MTRGELQQQMSGHLGIDEADDARKHPVLLLGGRACHIDRIGQFADGNFLMVRYGEYISTE